MSHQEEEVPRTRRTPRKNPQPMRRLHQSEVKSLIGDEGTSYSQHVEDGGRIHVRRHSFSDLVSVSNPDISKLSPKSCEPILQVADTTCGISPNGQDSALRCDKKENNEGLIDSTVEVERSIKAKAASAMGDDIKSQADTNLMQESGVGRETTLCGPTGSSPCVKLASQTIGNCDQGVSEISNSNTCKATQQSSITQEDLVSKVQKLVSVTYGKKGAKVKRLISSSHTVISAGGRKAKRLICQAKKLQIKNVVKKHTTDFTPVLENSVGHGNDKDLHKSSVPSTVEKEVGENDQALNPPEKQLGDTDILHQKCHKSNKVEVYHESAFTESVAVRVFSSETLVPLKLGSTTQGSAMQKDGFDPTSALAGLHKLALELTDLGKDSASLGTDTSSSTESPAEANRTNPDKMENITNVDKSILKTPLKCSRRNSRQSSTKHMANISPQKTPSLSPLSLRYLHRSPPIITGRSMFKSSPKGLQGSSTPNIPGNRNYRSPKTPSEKSRKTPTKETVKRRLSQTPQKVAKPGTSSKDLGEEVGRKSGSPRRSGCKHGKREKLKSKAKLKKPRRELAFGERPEMEGKDDGETGSSVGSESECEDDGKLTILTDIENDLDRDLENKSEGCEIPLNATNVRNIIRELIVNENVIDMVRNTLQEEGISDQLKEAIFEPKMTRSRVKEILGKGDITPALQLPHMWPISPIKVKKTGFMQISFEEDEEDEEYKPGVDDSERDSEDSESVLSSQASDLGSPTPNTPTTPNTPSTPGRRPKFLLDSDISTPKTPDCNRTPTIVPMGPPPTPRELARVKNTLKFMNQSADTSLQSSSFEEEEETIALRTRSKIPLTDTPLGEIESKLVAPDITPDMYDPYIDDQEWQDFLTSLTKANAVELNDTKDDEENDPEYNFMAEKEDEEDVLKERKEEKSIRVSKRELSDLVSELFEAYKCCDSADDNSQDVDLPSLQAHSTPNLVARPKSAATGSPLKWKDKGKKEKELRRKDIQAKTEKDDIHPSRTDDTPTLGTEVFLNKSADKHHDICLPSEGQMIAHGSQSDIALDGGSSQSGVALDGRTVTEGNQESNLQGLSLDNAMTLMVVQNLMSDGKKSNTQPKDELQCINMTHFLEVERIQLEDQMRKHTQLLTQMLILSGDEPDLQPGREEAKTLLLELKALGDKAKLPGVETSAFHACNLPWALELMEFSLPVEPEDTTSHLKRELKKCRHSIDRDQPRLSYEQMRMFCSQKVFIFPQMLPEGGLYPSNYVPKAKKVNFVYSEDMLLAMGLDQFGHMSNPYDYISKYLLPGKMSSNLAIRAKNLSCKRGEEDNPVKVLKKQKQLPAVQRYTELEDPDEIVPPEDRDPDLLPWWFIAYEKVSDELNQRSFQQQRRLQKQVCMEKSRMKAAQLSGGATGFSQYVLAPPNTTKSTVSKSIKPRRTSATMPAGVNVLSSSPAMPAGVNVLRSSSPVMVAGGSILGSTPTGFPIQGVLTPDKSGHIVLLPFPQRSPSPCLIGGGSNTIVTQLPVISTPSQTKMMTTFVSTPHSTPTHSPEKLTPRSSSAAIQNTLTLSMTPECKASAVLPVTSLRPIAPAPVPSAYMAPLGTLVSAGGNIVSLLPGVAVGPMSSSNLATSVKSRSKKSLSRCKRSSSGNSIAPKSKKQNTGEQKQFDNLLSLVNSPVMSEASDCIDSDMDVVSSSESAVNLHMTAVPSDVKGTEGRSSPLVVTSPTQLKQFSAQLLAPLQTDSSDGKHSVLITDDFSGDIQAVEEESLVKRTFSSFSIVGGKISCESISKREETKKVDNASLPKSPASSEVKECDETLTNLSEDEDYIPSSVSDIDLSTGTVIEKHLTASSSDAEINDVKDNRKSYSQRDSSDNVKNPVVDELPALHMIHPQGPEKDSKYSHDKTLENTLTKENLPLYGDKEENKQRDEKLETVSGVTETSPKDIEASSGSIKTTPGGIETTSSFTETYLHTRETTTVVTETSPGGIESMSSGIHEEVSSDSIKTALGGINTTSVCIKTSPCGTQASPCSIETRSCIIETSTGFTETLLGGIEITSGIMHTTPGGMEATSSVGETTSGVRETTSGVRETTSDDIETTSGNIEDTSDDTEATSGNIETTSGDTETMPGDKKTTSGNVEDPSGDTETTSSDIETTSDDTETMPGDKKTTSGNVEDPSGDTETTSSDIETTSDDTETMPGDKKTTSGNAEDPSGDTETTSSDIETTSAVTETTHAFIETAPGGTENSPCGIETTVTGIDTALSDIEATPGDIETISGDKETTSGCMETKSGIIETTSGGTETTSGSIEATPGSIEATPGSIEATPGSIETTLGGIETTPGDKEFSGCTDTTSGAIETTSGGTETTSGATETTPGSIETTPGGIETTPGGIETTPGFIETTSRCIENKSDGINNTSGVIETLPVGMGTTSDFSETSPGVKPVSNVALTSADNNLMAFCPKSDSVSTNVCEAQSLQQMPLEREVGEDMVSVVENTKTSSPVSVQCLAAETEVSVHLVNSETTDSARKLSPKSASPNVCGSPENIPGNGTSVSRVSSKPELSICDLESSNPDACISSDLVTLKSPVQNTPDACNEDVSVLNNPSKDQVTETFVKPSDSHNVLELESLSSMPGLSGLGSKESDPAIESLPGGVQVRHITLPVMTPQGTKMITLPVVVGPESTLADSLTPMSPLNSKSNDQTPNVQKSSEIALLSTTGEFSASFSKNSSASPSQSASIAASPLSQPINRLTSVGAQACVSPASQLKTLPSKTDSSPTQLQFQERASATPSATCGQTDLEDCNLLSSVPLADALQQGQTISILSPTSTVVRPQDVSLDDAPTALQDTTNVMPSQLETENLASSPLMGETSKLEASSDAVISSQVTPCSSGANDEEQDVTDDISPSHSNDKGQLEMDPYLQQSIECVSTIHDRKDIPSEFQSPQEAERPKSHVLCSPQGINVFQSATSTLTVTKVTQTHEGVVVESKEEYQTVLDDIAISTSSQTLLAENSGMDNISSINTDEHVVSELVIKSHPEGLNSQCPKDDPSHIQCSSATISDHVIPVIAGSSNNNRQDMSLPLSLPCQTSMTTSVPSQPNILSPTKLICDIPVSSTSTVTVYCGSLMSTGSSVAAVDTSLPSQLLGLGSAMTDTSKGVLDSPNMSAEVQRNPSSRDRSDLPHKDTSLPSEYPSISPSPNSDKSQLNSGIPSEQSCAPTNTSQVLESYVCGSPNMSPIKVDPLDHSDKTSSVPTEVQYDHYQSSTLLATPVKNLQTDDVVISPGYGSPLTPHATPTKGNVDTPTKSAVEIMAAIAKFMNVTPTKTPVKCGVSRNSPLKTPKSKETLLGIPRKRAAVPPTLMVTPVKYRAITPAPCQSTTPTKQYSPLKPTKKSPRRKILQERARTIAPKGLVISNYVSPVKLVAESLKAKAKKMKARPLWPALSDDWTNILPKGSTSSDTSATLAEPLKKKKSKKKAKSSKPPLRNILPKLEPVWDMQQTADIDTVDDAYPSDYDSLESDSASDDIQTPDENERESISKDKLANARKRKQKKIHKRRRLEAKENDSGSDECDIQMIPIDSQDEGDVDDDQDHLAALMAASTTIEFATKSGKSSLDAKHARKKGKQKRKRDLTLQMLSPNLLDADPQKDERDTAFAQSFLARVRKNLEGNKKKYEEFLRLLFEFQKSDNTPVQLYQDICSLLAEFPDLTADFAGFLLPDQAKECGCLPDNMQFSRARTFLRKLEIQFNKHPSHLQKIMKAMGDWQEKPKQGHRKLKDTVLPLLKEHPHLIDEFLLFFEEERPPESHLHGFEEVTFPDSDDDKCTYDGFEEVELPEGEEKYNGTQRCSCPCHVSRNKKRKKHCEKCALKIISGKLFLQYTVGTKKKLRPMQVVYTYPLSPRPEPAACHNPGGPADMALDDGDFNEANIVPDESDLSPEGPPKKIRKKHTKKLKLKLPPLKQVAGKFVDLKTVIDMQEDSGSQSRGETDLTSVPPADTSKTSKILHDPDEKSCFGQLGKSSDQPTDFSEFRSEIRRAQEKLAVKTVKIEQLSSYGEMVGTSNAQCKKNEANSLHVSSGVECTTIIDMNRASAGTCERVTEKCDPKPEIPTLNNVGNSGSMPSSGTCNPKDRCVNSHSSQVTPTGPGRGSDVTCSRVGDDRVCKQHFLTSCNSGTCDKVNDCKDTRSSGTQDVEASSGSALPRDSDHPPIGSDVDSAMLAGDLDKKDDAANDGKKERIILRINLADIAAKPVLNSPDQSMESEDGEVSSYTDTSEATCMEDAASLNWTKEEDKMILETCKAKGATQKAFQLVASQLQGRSMEQVQERFSHLLQLLMEHSRDMDSSGDSEDDDDDA